MTEYGKPHTDGSRSGGQKPVTDTEQAKVERVARAIAPMICPPIHNGDCDDVAAGQDFARRVARAAIAAMETDDARS